MLSDQDAAMSHPTGMFGGHVGAVGTGEALPSDVFLELARTLTGGHCLGCTRRGQPSTQARRARQANGRHGDKRRRRQRRWRNRYAVESCTAQEDRCTLYASGELSHTPASGATGDDTSPPGGGLWSASDSGSDKDDGDLDRRLCDDVFSRYERFAHAD